MNNLAHERDLARWYPLRDHPVQRALVEDEVRFKVVPAGRRSGKTERVKRYMARAAMQDPGNYFIAAPTRDQVKRIYWNDMKRLSFTSVLPDKASLRSVPAVIFDRVMWEALKRSTVPLVVPRAICADVPPD